MSEIGTAPSLHNWSLVVVTLMRFYRVWLSRYRSISHPSARNEYKFDCFCFATWGSIQCAQNPMDGSTMLTFLFCLSNVGLSWNTLRHFQLNLHHRTWSWSVHSFLCWYICPSYWELSMHSCSSTSMAFLRGNMPARPPAGWRSQPASGAVLGLGQFIHIYRGCQQYG